MTQMTMSVFQKDGSGRLSMRTLWSAPAKCGISSPVALKLVRQSGSGPRPRRPRDNKLISKRKKRQRETKPGRT